MSHRFIDRPLTRRQALGTLAAGAAAIGGLRLPAGPSGPAVVRAQQTIEQVGTTRAGTEVRYFPETGHNLKGPFLTRWQSAGGKDVLGAPLSEDRYAEDVGIVQTFETVTLIYDPALSAPWDVQAQHIPDSLRRELAPASARRAVTSCKSGVNNCQFFREKGHTISGRIREFWEAHGDLAIFGYPTTEPFQEAGTGITLQIFERAVLEDHGSDGVRLRPVARQLAEAAGLFADPAFLPAPPTGGETQLVRADGGLRLRGLPSLNAEIVMVLADNAEFIAAPGESGDWIGGYADGFAGWVSVDFLKSPPPLPKITVAQWNPSIWQGAALGETNVRREPTTASDIVEVLQYGDEVTVSDWVKGEEVFTGADLWAKIGAGKFVYARNIGRNAPAEPPPLPLDAPSIGRWIDVHLTQQLMTAYDGRNPLRVSVTTTGMAGWETPPGTYSILARVPNETMTSGAIGAENHYKLEDVLFTQYFTDRGHAIHYAWWRTPETIGRPGSHGCLNLLFDDSQYYWEWANIGTPVIVHY